MLWNVQGKNLKNYLSLEEIFSQVLSIFNITFKISNGKWILSTSKKYIFFELKGSRRGSDFSILMHYRKDDLESLLEKNILYSEF
jgi:hypothetical protein